MSSKGNKTLHKDQKLASNFLLQLSRQRVERFREASGGMHLQIEETGELVRIPQFAMDMLMEILKNMAEGRSVSVIFTDAELTTQQAADMLNVSRPHLVKLLEDGQIAHRKTGSHRRIRLEDLVRYRNQLDLARSKSLGRLAKQAQDLGLGYE
jgi:excisionase family DNA binding protein